MRLLKLALFTFFLSISSWLYAQPLNINVASAEQMAETLTGIGPSRAAAIIAYREAHGPFDMVDDLSKVKGIGPSILERNRDRIMVVEITDKDKPILSD